SGCIYTPVDCSDSDLCTTDKCEFGVCVNLPITCDDGDVCTSDVCVNGNCEFIPIACDDGDACTTDNCDPASGCVYTPVLCDDGDACTTDACTNGTCIYTAIVCNDSDTCTTDACVNGSCIYTPIPGCADPCAGINCDDGNPCTLDNCVNGICQYAPVDVNVAIEDVTPAFCQSATRKLRAVSSTAVSYLWSTGETTAEIEATPDATYSVTATGFNGCQAAASYTVPPANELLSSYLMLFAKEVDLHKNTVYSGGVGVSNSNGKAKIQNNSNITAPGTFVKANKVQLSGASSVTTVITEPAAVALPPFEFNNQCNAGQSLQIPSNSTVTLSGSLYNGITIGKNSMVTFTQSDLNIENIYAKNNTVIRFTAPCVKVRICKKLQLGENNSFNPDGSDVVVFVEKDVTIQGGSSVIADIYMNGGKFTVKKGQQNNTNMLMGLFIGNMLEAGDYTNWYQNPSCNPACVPVPTPCTGNERRVYSFTLVDARNDVDIGPLNNGDVIDLALTGPISVRANVCNDANVESVRFFVNGSFFKVENIPFYTIAGDNSGNYNPWNVQPGVYTIMATPYSGDNGSGTAGISHAITITIINSMLKMDAGDAMQPFAADEEVLLKAYPNPFDEKLSIEFSLADDSKVTLEIFNLAGQRLATLFDGNIKAAELKKVEFSAGSIPGGLVVYRLQTEKAAYHGKAIMVK
ncbi:MAG TPA: hypothetical protein VNJ07_11365, partial [Chitinophagales bacterium]|nr:hypothetical protein [Chitinophagales bacterium]